MLWAFLENLKKAVDLSCEETYSLALLNSTRCIGRPYFLNLQVEILLTCGVKPDFRILITYSFLTTA